MDITNWIKEIERLKAENSEALAMVNSLDAEVGRLTDHIDLMADEFKRIRAIHYDQTPHNLEVQGLCDRAISNTIQRVPVIEQRDKAESEVERLTEKLAGEQESGAALVTLNDGLLSLNRQYTERLSEMERLLHAYRFVFSRKILHDNDAMSALKSWQPAMFETIMADIEKENRIMKPPAHE